MILFFLIQFSTLYLDYDVPHLVMYSSSNRLDKQLSPRTLDQADGNLSCSHSNVSLVNVIEEHSYILVFLKKRAGEHALNTSRTPQSATCRTYVIVG